MSKLNRNQLLSRVVELYECVAANPEDQQALAELDSLLSSQVGAREMYLDYVCMQVQLRSSDLLGKEDLDKSGDLNADLLAVPISASPSANPKLNTNPKPSASPKPSANPSGNPSASLSRKWAIGLCLAVSFCLATMLIYSAATSFTIAKRDPAPPAVDADPAADQVPPDAAVSENNTLATTGAAAPLPAVGTVNNLAHPGSVMRVTGGATDDGESLPETISFNLHVRSILSENCYYCHGPDPNYREAGLRLDTAEGSEWVIDVDDPKASEMIVRIDSEDDDVQMPPPDSGRVLSNYERKILERWIEQGGEYEPHWAFIAPKKPMIPTVTNAAWPRNEVDNFVLAKLEERNIKPSPRAKPQVIVRRLHLDLTGLPPTIDQVDTFVSAYEKNADAAIDGLVDQLLTSPHYGERMALPWLDAARYSDSNGFQRDGDRHQWPWRDWVVDAFNTNMPFDQFTVEQLAGDLLPSPTNSQLIATGFNRNHMINGEGGAILEEQRNNYVFDRVDTTATTWLGLTMACCQCHDHKYDPLTQQDYFSFFAFFNNVDENGGVDLRAGRLQCGKPLLKMPSAEQQKNLTEINQAIEPVAKSLKDDDEKITAAMTQWEPIALADTPKDIGREVLRILNIAASDRLPKETQKLKDYYLSNFADAPWRETKTKLKKLTGKRNRLQSKITTVMVMRERSTPRQTHVLIRGEYENEGAEVDPGVPTFLPTVDNGEHKDRLALARWLVNANNPLTSRVTVNRFWQTFYGVGLVKTAEDFGVQGELPSHGKLLDWLAVDFVEHDWDVKRIVRLMVTSETYLQTGRYRGDLVDLDPENRLLARSPRYRMPSMLIRDAALSVAGLLNRSVGGKPVYPYQPPGLWKEFSLDRFEYEPSSGRDLYRRSLYTFWRRTVAPPNMFDAANRQTCIVKNARTNTPLHALVMLNDPTFVEASCRLAQNMIEDEKSENDSDRLRLGFFTAMGRHPKEKELAALSTALHESRQYFDDHTDDALQFLGTENSIVIPTETNAVADLAAMASVMQIIINTDEFMTRE